jgi:hydrogenase maturation protease
VRRVVIGVGNAYRGDDGAGPAVAERLRGRLPDEVEVTACEQEPTRLIDAWRGADLAVIVDAVESGAQPGTLHRFDAGDAPIPESVFRSSTHAFGIGETIELSRALETLPPRVLVYGIEGAAFGAGVGLSGPVQTAVEQAARGVREDIEEEFMHERALMRDVMTKIEEVAQAGGAVRVTRVGVRLGALSHFTPAHFRERFDDAAIGTIAQGAEVDAVLDEDIGGPRARDVVLESVEVES